MVIDRDEFEAWLADPVTRIFFKALENYAQQARDQLNEAAWAGSYITPQEQAWMAHLRGRASATDWFSEIDFEDLEGLIKEE